LNKHFPNIIAVLQALLVTFLWSTSFIIIKWGLAEIPPITFAGYRYFLAFIIFTPFVIQPKFKNELFGLSKAQIKKLILLGIVFYVFTQGTVFLGLSLLPAVTVSLMLNFTPLVVAVLGIFFLREIPSALQ
jgi:drug/metabolite transporter (DMT)-like permease